MQVISAPSPETATRLRPIRSLPSRNQAFTGRTTLLERVAASMRDGGQDGPADEPGVVSLIGMGGIGKTQLALEYAHRHAQDYGLVWWVGADQLAAVMAGLTALASQLGLTAVQPSLLIRALWVELAARDDWLLVYDNLDDLGAMNDLLPPDGGKLLITGRDPRIGRIGTRIDVPEFERDESITLLSRRCPTLSPEDADRVAAAVGDLPLSVEQVGCFLDETGLETSDYLRLLESQPTESGLDDRTVSAHPGLVSVVATSRDRLVATAGPTAATLLDRLAFLAPEPIPLGSDPAVGPPRFGVQLGDTATAALAVRKIVTLGLARHADNSLQMHRLVHTLLRARLPQEEHGVIHHAAEELLATIALGDPDTPESWPEYGMIVPHVRELLSSAAALPGPQLDADGFRALVLKVQRYLYFSGQSRSAVDICRITRESWTERLGPDHPDTLNSGYNLASNLFELGEYAQAKEVDQDVWERRCRVLGMDHPDTIRSAHQLAADLCDLGDFAGARALDEQGWQHRSRLLGEDHPDTLQSAHYLGSDLYELGEREKARDINEEVWRRRQRVLGETHPDTLHSAHHLASDLCDLGELERARELELWVLEQRRRRLGEDHPDTLRSRHYLAITLHQMGDYTQARELNEEVWNRRRQLHGDDHPDTLRSAYSLGDDLAALGEHARARELHRDTLVRRRRVLGEGHPDTKRSAQALAEVPSAP
ncbi:MULTISPECIES: FxSxx-COOH system tetratricopeptide repeat protein [Streptomyces]|uniref:FxSxx-COOH system tetratricopeptide repeat protein n=1 Tax=Streptomyces TaxID=1883 RepID=UPI0013DD988C|nr:MULTISPECIES: FxSxx-COOH system tetratricopeptide repeat protein [Streptomyces]MCF2536273.1 FxSxx-COOH system tetratricopeptide repeat protein [Streptomyces sp. FB2]